MSVPRPHKNIAARMGRWSASHRKLAIFGWLAFVLSAIVVGTAVGQKTIDQQNNNVGQANRADQILKQAGFTESGPLTEFVVIQNHKLTIHDPAFQAAVRDVVSAVSPYKGQFHNLRSPLARGEPRSGHTRRATALVEFDMNGTLKSAENRIDPLTNAVASVAKANPKFYVGEAGAVSSDKALNKMFNQQIGQAGNSLGAAHAADPRARVRLAAGGVRSADARAPVGRRDDRTGRDRQPPHADGPERGRGRDARRARRRRRLLAVLPPARARRARRGPR